MFVKKYYSRYKKTEPKVKIKDDGVFEIVNRLLQFPWILGGTKDFLLSIKKLYEKHGELTKSQIDTIKKIEEKNSEETLSRYNEWALSYDENKKRIAFICANYYKNNPPYFSQLSERILNEPGFTPSEKQYKSMCENKFTKKVIAATEAESKYCAGTIVKGRKSAPADICDKLFSVIRINAKPVQSAAKGAKIYEILPFGKTQTIFCEERFLRKTRKSEA